MMRPDSRESAGLRLGTPPPDVVATKWVPAEVAKQWPEGSLVLHWFPMAAGRVEANNWWRPDFTEHFVQGGVSHFMLLRAYPPRSGASQ